MRRSSKQVITRTLIVVCCAATVISVGCNRKSKPVTKVTVAGEAVTKVEPDAAVVVLSVVTQNAQAITAQQENARKSEAVANAVKSTAGADVEIKTSDYVLQPQYDNRENRLPKIIGYDARNSVTITSSDLKNVGAIIDAASRSGANSIDSVSFIIRQTSPARGQALSDATQQAMNKARSIAQALGGRVIRVVEESEGVNALSPADGSTYNGDLVARSRITTPIQVGQLNVRAYVQLIVEIES